LSLALALDKSGNHAGERTALELAVQLDVRMIVAKNQLGYLDASEGDAKTATQHFQLAVEAALRSAK
jgi:Flp pilus assembly protein TadD